MYLFFMAKNIIRQIFLCIILICYCNLYSVPVNSNKNNVINDSKNNKKDKKKNIVRILALDGGGTRGYAQVKFLERFCKDANIKNLGKIFDIIAGTSIGGINAVAFANGMMPEDLEKFFTEKAKWIFTIRSIKDIFSNNASIPSNKPNKLQMLYMISTSNPFYKSVSEKSNYGSARLFNEMKKVFEDKLLTQLETNVILPAYDFSTCTPIIFTNIKSIQNTFTNIKIVDALMATASFPIYFSSFLINSKNIVDGGFFQCNPSMLAFTVAKKIYPSAKKYCVLSIGTGRKKYTMDFESKNIIYNLLPMKYTRIWDVFNNSSKFANNIFLQNLSNNKDSNVYYYRFDFDLDQNRNCSFDTSTEAFFDYLKTAVNEKYNQDINKIKQFIINFTE